MQLRSSAEPLLQPAHCRHWPAFQIPLQMLVGTAMFRASLAGWSLEEPLRETSFQ